MLEKTVKVALVNIRPCFEFEKTLAKAEMFAEECAKNGVK